MSEERRLAAIMFTDMVGFTALMGSNEARARQLVEHSRLQIRSFVERFHGRWLEEIGDGTLSAFPSAVEAVNCAWAIQNSMKDEPEIVLRIGIHLGDVVFADGRVYGDGVNVASRIEALAPPGGVTVSDAVGSAIRGHPEVRLSYQGRKRLKNVGEPVRVYTLEDASQRRRIVRGSFHALWVRRVPHVLAAYVCLVWLISWLAYWLAAKYGLHGQWPDALVVGLVALVPGVGASVFFRADPGRARRAGDEDRRWNPGRFALWLNLMAVFAAMTVMVHDAPLPSEPAASIGVLPFANVSRERHNDYFSDGLTDEIINTLSRLDAVNVASRTSSFMFKNTQKDVETIASELDVQHVLEGSVRKAGQRMRIFVQLVDGATGYTLWQQTYERSMDDIFEVQESIARSVVSQLGVMLPAADSARLRRRPTENIEAYTFFLQGLEYLHRPPTKRHLDVAENLFNNALMVDSGYAQAYSGLCQVELARYELTNAPRHIDSGESACRSAMELDSNLPEVRIALGNLYRHKGRLEEAERLFREVLDESPRLAKAWVGLGKTLQRQGGAALGEAEDALRRAVSLQPADWSTHMALGNFLYWQLRYEEALMAYERLTELMPDNHQAWSSIGAINLLRGNMEKGLHALQKSLAISPSRATYRNLGLANFYLGNFEASIEAYEKALEMGGEDLWSWGDYGDALRHSGDTEEARAAYARAADLARAVLDKESVNWKVQARLAVYQHHLGAPERARELMQECIEHGSGIPEVLYYGAQLDVLQGRNDPAESKLQKAIAGGLPQAIILPHPDLASLEVEKQLTVSGGQPTEEGNQ